MKASVPDRWPIQYVEVGSSTRYNEGVRFKVSKWAPTGPHPKTKVAFQGRLETGQSIKLIYHLSPKGERVDFELIVDGQDVPCRRTDIYRDGGSQMFMTSKGKLWFPQRMFKTRTHRPIDLDGIKVIEEPCNP